MKTLTITAARRRFGAMLDLVRHEPVLITRENRKGAVIMSAKDYNGMIIRGDADLLALHPWRDVAILSSAEYLQH